MCIVLLGLLHDCICCVLSASNKSRDDDDDNDDDRQTDRQTYTAHHL